MATSTITTISNTMVNKRPTPIEAQSRNTSEHERGTFAFSLGLACLRSSVLALARVTFTAAPWER